jgi:hypothetical protein
MAYNALKKAVIKKYTTPVEPGSFTSSSKIGKQHFKGTELKHIEQALENVDAYTKHKRYQRRFPRRKTQTYGIDRQWQTDLIEMIPFAKENKGYKYILVAIDVFSRQAFAQPLKSKKSLDVLEGFEVMTKDRKPHSLQSDKGKEFLNTKFQDYLKDNDIDFFTGENDDVKCALAERFNSTLQSKLWRYFTYVNTYKWYDVLQPMIKSYNNTYHKTLGCTPAEVTPENSNTLFYRLYEQAPKKTLKALTLKKGEKVRMLKKKKTFNRGYEPNWTEELFSIDRVKATGYKLKDTLGEEIKGTFYQPEVQKVAASRSKRYDIETVLKYRGRGRTKQGLVKWKGYGEKFNTWEPVKNITKWRSQ